MPNAKKKIRVARYIRVSTDEQVKDGYGLETQIRILDNEVEKYSNEGWYSDDSLLYRDEGVSGASDERPAFKKMMKDAEQGKIDLVLVWKIDRFFRKLEYLLRYVQRLGEFNVQFKSSTEPFDTSAVGKLVFQMMGALAEFERELILQRTMEGKMSKAKEGKYVGGAIPYGYDIKDEVLVINKKEASIVKKIFIWFVKQEMPIMNIKRILNDPKNKLLTKGDKQSKKSGRKSLRKKNPEGYWSPDLIRNILNREQYTGKYYYNRFTRDKKTKKKIEKPRSEWQEYSCPPIIDEPLFGKAKIQLAKNRQKSGGRKHDYLFSGKIWCGEDGCDNKYTGYVSKKKTKNYRCKNKGVTNAFKCPSHGLSESMLDKLVWKYVEPFFRNPKRILEKMVKDQRSSDELQAINDRISNITTEIQRLSTGEDTVRGLIRNGGYTAEEAKEEFDLIRKEMADLRDERTALSSQLISEEEKQMRIVSIESVTRKYRKNFKNLTYKQKMDLYSEVIKKIWIKGNKIRIDVVFPKLDDNSGGGGGKNPPNKPKTPQGGLDNLKDVYGDPTGNRTPISRMKTWRPNR